jgi:membrane fusion protein, multidrug efflux system
MPYRRRASRLVPLLLSSAALVTVACSKPAAKPVRTPVSVAVTPAKRTSLPFTLEANGTVTPLQTASVASQVDGIVQEVLFEEGREVTKGQLLFRIDPRPYRAAYQAAQAALARDHATMENLVTEADRYEKLMKSQVVTQEEFEARRSAAASSRAIVQADSAALANAQFGLDNTTVRAPISGRTGSLLVRAGNLARANGGTPLVVINQVRPILVRFSVPGSQLPMILHYGGGGRGLPVTVSPNGTSAPVTPPPTSATPAPPDASPTSTPPTRPVMLAGSLDDPPTVGSLYFIDNAVDTTTGTVQLKAKFDNKSGTLWAGQFVAASLRLFVEDSALVVPAQCVVTGQRGTYVYVIDSASVAQQRIVTVERTTNGLAVITSGLKDGERVVTDGQSRLTQGATVDLRSGRDSAGGGRGGGRGGRGGGGGGRGKGKSAPAP